MAIDIDRRRLFLIKDGESFVDGALRHFSFFFWIHEDVLQPTHPLEKMADSGDIEEKLLEYLSSENEPAEVHSLVQDTLDVLEAESAGVPGPRDGPTTQARVPNGLTSPWVPLVTLSIVALAGLAYQGYQALKPTQKKWVRSAENLKKSCLTTDQELFDSKLAIRNILEQTQADFEKIHDQLSHLTQDLKSQDLKIDHCSQELKMLKEHIQLETYGPRLVSDLLSSTTRPSVSRVTKSTTRQSVSPSRRASLKSTTDRNQVTDALENVKKEIRNMKGLILSSRAVPSPNWPPSHLANSDSRK